VYRRSGEGWLVVLGARRRPDDGALVWSIPKGHVEAGESDEDAALREVREETGLDAEIEKKLGDVTYFYLQRRGDGTTRRVEKRVRFFLMRHRGGRFADRDREMEDVRWVPLAEAETMIPYANERRLVRRATAHLERAEPA
jgi:8-oxo-dGTP pyrophosphatase MutT (NUDIX family)